MIMRLFEFLMARGIFEVYRHQNVYSWLLATVFLLPCGLAADVCPRGHYLYTPRSGIDICLPCNGGTFLPEGWHKIRSCYDCTRISEPFVEILVSNCNKTHDAEITCVEGYYRTKSTPPHERGQCKQCTKCDYPVRECHGYEDTVCCPGPSFALGVGEEGKPVCVKQCGRGEYIDVTSDKCLPCPQGTFLHAEKHIATECQPCTALTDTEVVLLPCTARHDTVKGCVNGYYRQRRKHHHGLHRDVCIKCSDCCNNTAHPFQGRKCDVFHDTVCCPRPNMTVVDTTAGPSCQTVEKPMTAAPVFCGISEYLYSSPKTGFTACLPCPATTYMDERNHNHTKCKNCKDFQDRQIFSPCQRDVPQVAMPEELQPAIHEVICAAITLASFILILAIFYILFYNRRKSKELMLLLQPPRKMEQLEEKGKQPSQSSQL